MSDVPRSSPRGTAPRSPPPRKPARKSSVAFEKLSDFASPLQGLGSRHSETPQQPSSLVKSANVFTPPTYVPHSYKNLTVRPLPAVQTSPSLAASPSQAASRSPSPEQQSLLTGAAAALDAVDSLNALDWSLDRLTQIASPGPRAAEQQTTRATAVEQIRQLGSFEQMDSNQDGVIDRAEFITGRTRMVQQAVRQQAAKLAASCADPPTEQQKRGRSPNSTPTSRPLPSVAGTDAAGVQPNNPKYPVDTLTEAQDKGGSSGKC